MLVHAMHGALLFCSESKSAPYSETVGKLLQMWVTSSQDIDQEALILLGIFWLLIVPQVLSYLTSGVFGCASKPVFVSKITSFIAWSFIKGLVVLSGLNAITLYAIFFMRLSPRGFSYTLIEQGFILCLFQITMSFFVLMVYYKASSVLSALANSKRLELAYRVHQRLTRHREKPEKDPEVEITLMEKYYVVRSIFDDVDAVVGLFADAKKYKGEIENFMSTLPKLITLEEFEDSLASSFGNLNVDPKKLKLLARKLYEASTTTRN